jgi:hypothetical protein
MHQKIEVEKRARSRMEVMREGALEVKEQRAVILDLKSHLKQRELFANR